MDKKMYKDAGRGFNNGSCPYLGGLSRKAFGKVREGIVPAAKGYHNAVSKLPTALQSVAYTTPVIGGTVAYSTIAEKPKNISTVMPMVARW
jgi:hypothetical protein